MEITHTHIQWIFIGTLGLFMYAILIFILSRQIKKYSLTISKKHLFGISLISLALLYVSHIILLNGILILLFENAPLIQNTSKIIIVILTFISIYIGPFFAFYSGIRIGLGKVLEDIEKVKKITNNTTWIFIGLIIFIEVTFRFLSLSTILFSS